jgi:hypothetical protein
MLCRLLWGIAAGTGLVVSTDVNGDGKLDIVVVDTNRVLAYENPSWQRQTLIEGQTKTDNVCIAPHDIDGDGKVDFALGADWGPPNTLRGTLQWLARGASPGDKWTVHPIGDEPSSHRIRWADLNADGRPELISLPLHGRGATGPAWAERGVRIAAYSVPAKPTSDPWPMEVLNEDLHVAHNFHPTDLDRDGKLDLLVVSFEGVHLLKRAADGRWSRTQIGSGNQETMPNKGASEIKHGRLAGGGDYIATIEPWHGFQVVVYTPPEPNSGGSQLWKRQVLDEQLRWGHAVWCANLDADEDQELIIGVRDNQDAKSLCGLRIYDPADASGTKWNRQLVDAGGVAIEDLAAADLDADGRIDIVAVGRRTKNARIYWNKAK